MPLRLDRCFVRGLTCGRAEILPRATSDHHPIMVRLSVPAGASKAALENPEYHAISARGRKAYVAGHQSVNSLEPEIEDRSDEKPKRTSRTFRRLRWRGAFTLFCRSRSKPRRKQKRLDRSKLKVLCLSIPTGKPWGLSPTSPHNDIMPPGIVLFDANGRQIWGAEWGRSRLPSKIGIISRTSRCF